MTITSIGAKLPDFRAAATSDQTVTLASLKGKAAVIYFYPKDNTPGCTQEGQDFRDHYAEFQNLDTNIYGISRDSLKAHENFRAKFEFPFELISDPDETLCKLFDVIKLKKMYGKESMGVERSTFLIDSEGVLIKEWRKVKVNGHVEEVLTAVREL